MKTRVAIALLACMWIGCSVQIPNKVTAEEYAIYSAWLKDRTINGRPGALYVANRTLRFDPFETRGCADSLQRDGVPKSLMNQLNALGDAEFKMDLLMHPEKLKISKDYKVFRDFEPEPASPYSIVSLSRVAFNRTYTEALFKYFSGCGGECGGGSAVYAKKENGVWSFRNVGCITIAAHPTANQSAVMSGRRRVRR